MTSIICDLQTGVLPARIEESCVVVGRLFSMVRGLEVKNVGGGMCLW